MRGWGSNARGRLAASLLALGALAALAVAWSAMGALASAEALSPPSGFALKAGNGYSMFVLGSPEDAGEPAAALIFVLRKNRGAAYFAPATVTETSIEADLGALGRIAVAFHSSGKARTVASRCGEGSVTFDSGYYEGMIEFHGEEGYTSVEATRARGDVALALGLICPAGSGGSVTRAPGPFALPGAKLDVKPSRPRLGPHMTVVKNRPTARVHFEAGFSEKHDGIWIDRYVSKIASPRTFKYDPLIRTATLRPPPPFSGSAQFHRGAKPANRWTGDLTVDLPGKSDAKLTGSGVQASLVNARWNWRERRQRP